MLLPLLLQLAVDDRVGDEIARYCARVPAAARARCAAAQQQAARRTFDASRVGDDGTPAATAACLERSRSRGAIDWTRAARCAEGYARAHPAAPEDRAPSR